MMVLGKILKIKELIMSETMSFVIGTVLIAITGMCCATYYNLHKTDAMKSNIESAIVKGIDPVSVRCAYESSDSVCVAYAASHGKVDITPKK
jgi:hypothetical protein